MRTFNENHLALFCLAGLSATSGCKTYVDSYVPTVSSTVTSMTSASSSTSTTATYTPASGTGYSSFTVDLGIGYQAANVCSTATIFGLAGTASCSVAGTSTVV